jgi:pyruvate kinase
VPLFFDASVFEQDTVEASAIEFLRDEGQLHKGDAVLLTKGAIMGRPGSTNIMKILPVT